MKDFFISYTGRDRTWAEWIAWTLEEAGYSVVIQAWDFRPGGNFVLDMQQATQATRTIAVLSALYLDKPFTQPEWAAAFAQDPTSRDRKLIPVRVEACAPPGLLAQIVYVDIFDCEEIEAKARLLSAIAEGRMKPSQKPQFPGQPPERVAPNLIPFPGNPSSLTPPSSTAASSPDSLPDSQNAISHALSTYDESTWVGRDDLISDLTQRLESGCRILTILGITGIGKTALAERVVVDLQAMGKPFCRLNFDDRGQGRDFLSSALTLLPKLGEVVTTEDQKDTQNALKHLLVALRTKPFLVQIDSVEMLLEGDEQHCWSAFSDGLWLDFFQQLLAGQECQSQVILTTQALPEELEIAASRYPLLWHLRSVGGLSEPEQLQLFHKNGLMPDEMGNDYLRRIGKLYDGHPLVLQVIAKDILSRPFNGNVAQYWQRYQGEFDAAESDRRQKSSSPRALQLRVKKRVEESLERLPQDAYQMLCRSSVYRRPVPESFWLAMLGDEMEERQWAALEMLKSHNLIEEEISKDGLGWLRQHNLIKRVGGELLRAKDAEWRKAHSVAAQMWLENYDPEPSTPNLEKVKGQLEAFHHHCEVEAWESAKTILIDQGLGDQLQTWSYFREMMPLYQRLLGRTGAVVDMICNMRVSNAFWGLSYYPQAIEHTQQSLGIAREIGDRKGEGTALECLGGAYWALSNYPKAIAYQQQSLDIFREIGDRQGEATTLGCLGITYKSEGNYAQAIECFQRWLDTAREIGDRQGEARALYNLGDAYYHLRKYSQAIDYQKQGLAIFREIGDRRREGKALGMIGKTLNALESYTQGATHHRQCLNIVQEVKDRQGEGNALLQLSISLMNLKQYADAKQLLQAAIEIFAGLGDRTHEAEAFLNLGILHYKTGCPDSALDYCNQARSIAIELGIPLAEECEAFLATLQSEGEPA